MTVDETKRPAFQFYPDKWQSDKALRTCSIGARGLWAELMCVMHTCLPYGHLADAKGRPMVEKDAAQLCGVPLATFRKLMAELEDKGVSSRSTTGIIFSRRMVRDERVRNARAEGGPLGAQYGHLGAEHGKKGGRQRKQKGADKGANKPPSIPPPVVVVASASVSASAGSKATATPKTIAPGVAARPADAEGRTVEAWGAYTTAYEQRHGAAPTRNRTVNGQMAAFLERVPASEAAAIAAHYVRSNRGLYVSAKHPVNLLVRDAEALRTEWLTQTHGTETQARQSDRTQAVYNSFGNLIREAEANGD